MQQITLPEKWQQ